MTKQASIVEYMNSESVKGNIQKTIGRKTPQFIASVASLVSSNQQLRNCEQSTVMAACLKAANLDLPIDQNLGFAYIIPYKDQAQFQMGWKGFVQLAMRSGQMKTVNVTDVREGEIKSRNRVSGEIEFEWIEDADREKAAVVGYVAYFKLNNGFEKLLYMTTEQLTKHAGKYSQSFKRNSSSMNLWRDDFDVMAAKTVVKLLLAKYAPMTIEMQQAVLADQAVITDEGYKYIDGGAVNPEDIAEEAENERLLAHIKKANTLEQLDDCREAVEQLSVNDEAYKLFEVRETELLEKASNK